MVAVLVGGLLREHSQSSRDVRAVDRSYAVQARFVVEGSNRLGEKLRFLLGAMPGQSRTSLQLALDTLVRSSASLAGQAATVASPPPSGAAGADVATAMADRAEALQALRSAVDGLLGMAPLPVVGAPEVALRPPRRLTVAAAAAEMAKAGRLLARGDRSYAAGRRALRLAPGHALLPPSVWSGRTSTWVPGGTLVLARALIGSPSLAAVHRVELVTQAVALTPAPVPSTAAGATPGGPATVLPPTGRVRLTVVVANNGNVAERGILVQASVRPSGGAAASGSGAAAGVGHAETSTRVVLSAGSSESLPMPAIPVVPGRRYTITVAVDPPIPDTAGVVTSDTVAVRVAPPASPAVGQLLPAKGPSAGGSDVTILGSGFTWVQTVTFGRTIARFKVVSSTQVTAVAPPGTGTVAVHVTNPGGASASAPADLFRYRRK